MLASFTSTDPESEFATEGNPPHDSEWSKNALENARAQLSLEGLEARFAERSVFGGNDYSFDDEDGVLQE